MEHIDPTCTRLEPFRMGKAVIFGVGFVLKGHGLVPLFDLTRFGWGDNRAGGDRAASFRIAAQRRMRPRQKIVPRGMPHLRGRGIFWWGCIAVWARSTQLRPAGPSLPISKSGQIERAGTPAPRNARTRCSYFIFNQIGLPRSWPPAKCREARPCQMPTDLR